VTAFACDMASPGESLRKPTSKEKTPTADSIIAKVERPDALISGKGHSHSAAIPALEPGGSYERNWDRRWVRAPSLAINGDDPPVFGGKRLDRVQERTDCSPCGPCRQPGLRSRVTRHGSWNPVFESATHRQPECVGTDVRDIQGRSCRLFCSFSLRVPRPFTARVSALRFGA